MDAQRATDVALQIGEHLVETAYWHDGRCTWMGMFQRSGDADERVKLSYETLGPGFYGGTAGVGLFLTELHALTGHGEIGRTAAGAVRHALDRVELVPSARRRSFYSGWVGVAWVAVRAARALDLPDLSATAAELLTGGFDWTPDDGGFDIISGAAGAIPPLLALSRDLDRSDLAEKALDLGRELVDSASRGKEGASWTATGFPVARPLTGFSHGAAGAGWALTKLHEVTGEAGFARVADEAFAYENGLFDEDRRDWPDFRKADGAKRPAPLVTRWCHGAPGIGLSRVPSLHTPDGGRARSDVQAALDKTCSILMGRSPGSDFSPCHGTAGLVECVQLMAAALGIPVPNGAEALVSEGADRWSATPADWPCGVRQGSNPSMMLGLAGIGYFYLRQADPSLPSVLLPGGF